MTNQNLTASNIKYLLTVAVLLEKDRGVRCVDVAKYLNVARPSALRALECLQSLKLLCRDECGVWDLTKYGTSMAKQYHHFYKIVWDFFCQLLPPTADRVAVTYALLAEIPLKDMDFVCQKLQAKSNDEISVSKFS